jgi:hypothetical protein
MNYLYVSNKIIGFALNDDTNLIKISGHEIKNYIHHSASGNSID